jgi:predicted dehydrogenase
MLKVALVGVGGWSSAVHGPALAHYAKEHPGEVELAAVCVRRNVERARRFCEQFGFARVYTDVDEMIDKEEPGACWVVAPVEGTRQLAGRVMERGVPVIFEKPPGRNLEEAKELAEISRRTDTPNMVAFNRRFAPCTKQALLWAKEHGPFEYLYARMLRSARMDEEFAFGTGIHLLDCVRALAEATVGGVKSARVVRAESLAGRFSFHVDLVFASGGRGRCDILPTCGVVEESYVLFGSNQTIVSHLPWIGGATIQAEGKAELWVQGEMKGAERWPALPLHLSSGFYQEATAFIAALKEGRRPSPSAEEAVDSVALAEAVQEGRDIEFS